VQRLALRKFNSVLNPKFVGNFTTLSLLSHSLKATVTFSAITIWQNILAVGA
jgi:hypothetical protein